MIFVEKETLDIDLQSWIYFLAWYPVILRYGGFFFGWYPVGSLGYF